MVNNDTQVIVKNLYPLVASSLDKNSKKFINNMASFFNSRHSEIYDIAPYTIIYFNRTDKDNMFNSLGISELQVENIIKGCYFYGKGFNPACAEDPCTETLLCAVRYYVLNNQTKNAELTTTYLLFSGKFYASLHSGFWKFGVNKQVMDYVINNMLSDKFDLKKEGTLFKAIYKLGKTWLQTYSKKLVTNNLMDYGGIRILLQQLRDREKSFLKNIATLYYEANENKLYLNYETDNPDPDNYRLTSNDMATASRITEATMSIMTSQKVSMDLCNKCKNENVKPIDVKNIMEFILGQNENLSTMRRVVNILICDFLANNTGKRVGSADFISYSIAAKPNTKNKLIIELKTTITGWINDAGYRKKRVATANNYYRAILTYIVLVICKASLK